jgi:cell filamentation protein, protein adenylyltransferase
MSLEIIIQKIDQLNTDLDKFRPLTDDQLARLNQKLRLDWNYHSNHIEGNSLTYGETKSLLLWGITAQNKPISDHLEIKGHNEAVEFLMSVVRNDEQYDISENNIRQLHQLILPKDSFSKAMTEDGIETRKKITPGKYKTQPNNVRTSTGDLFAFTSPEDTPAKMQELVEWYKKAKKDKKLHPIALATAFHYRFVRIHPFDDGNGRMARILMNLIIMQNGFPPAIIHTERKDEYLLALEHADQAGDIEQFTEFVGEAVVASLEMELKAARGETIEDPDDIDKKVALLQKKIDWGGMDEEVNETISEEVVLLTFKNSIYSIISRIKFLLDKLSNIGKIINITAFNGKRSFFNFNTFFEDSDEQQKISRLLLSIIHQKKVTFNIIFGEIVINTNKSFMKQFSINFEQAFIEYSIPSSNMKIQRRYHQQLTEDEIEMIASEVFDSIYSEIEKIVDDKE